MRADQERRFVENVLMLMKHLESLQLSSWDSRLVCLDQLFFMGLRMDTIKVGSTLAERTTETSSMINIVPCVEILLRLAMALPHHYWQGISQHSSRSLQMDLKRCAGIFLCVSLVVELVLIEYLL